MSNTRRLRQAARTEVLYARLPADLVEWIRVQAGRSGLSMAQAAGTMLAYCREAGLTLEPQPLLRALVARDTARLELAEGNSDGPHVA